jgi:hypothetical protein
VSLVSMAQELNISDYVTIAQAARIKSVSYAAMRMFLRNHPGKITTRRVGTSVLLYVHDLEKYTPMR